MYIDAQLLFSDNLGGDVSVYSPWFYRQADKARFTLDIVATNMVGADSLTVVAFHKNIEDVGNGTQVAATSVSKTTTGRVTKEFGPFKEVVRYRFTVSGAATGGRVFAFFRMLNPQWFDLVEA